MKPKLEKIEPSQPCLVDEDFDFIENDKSLSLFERGQYTKELTDDLFDDGSHYSREAYKSSQFGRKVADKKDGVRCWLTPGSFANLQGSYDGVTEFYGEDKFGTGYLDTPKRMFALVRQGRMLEVKRSNHPYMLLHMTLCSAVIGVNKENICVAHVGMSNRNETEGVLKYMNENGYYDKNIFVVASTGEYQEARAEELGDNMIMARADDYLDMNVPAENILEFAIDRVEDGADSIYQNMTGVIVSNEMIYKYSYDLREIGGLFGHGSQVESRMIETEVGMEEVDCWDEAVIELGK